MQRLILGGMVYGGLRKTVQLLDATVIEYVATKDKNDHAGTSYNIQKMRLPMLTTTKAVVVGLSFLTGGVAWPVMLFKDVYEFELMLRRNYGKDPRYDSTMKVPENCFEWIFT